MHRAVSDGLGATHIDPACLERFGDPTEPFVQLDGEVQLDIGSPTGQRQRRPDLRGCGLRDQHRIVIDLAERVADRRDIGQRREPSSATPTSRGAPDPSSITSNPTGTTSQACVANIRSTLPHTNDTFRIHVCVTDSLCTYSLHFGDA
jgi:hypothetical protein